MPLPFGLENLIANLFGGDICSFILRDVLRYRACTDPVADLLLRLLLPFVVIYLYADVVASKIAGGKIFARMILLFVIFFVIIWYNYYGFFVDVAWGFLVLMMIYYFFTWMGERKKMQGGGPGAGEAAGGVARKLAGRIGGKLYRRHIAPQIEPYIARTGFAPELEKKRLQEEIEVLEGERHRVEFSLGASKKSYEEYKRAGSMTEAETLARSVKSLEAEHDRILKDIKARREEIRRIG